LRKNLQELCFLHAHFDLLGKIVKLLLETTRTLLLEDLFPSHAVIVLKYQLS
jgi:hypothetical protein